MKISLEKAIELLSKASAIVFDDNSLAFPLLKKGNLDEDQFVFLQLDATDILGSKYYAFFRAGNNRKVVLADSCIFLTDTCGETFQISLLTDWDVQKDLK